ncbi:Hypothetical predicted protein [Paramuricea clavata]|nr:Hypothetical predicted protein [Paramuricea clavata]
MMNTASGYTPEQQGYDPRQPAYYPPLNTIPRHGDGLVNPACGPPPPYTESPRS